MIKLLFILFMLIIQHSIFPQRLSQGKYWVRLSDKSGNVFSISKPEEFLSQRSLERRARQKIDISDEDLPVSNIYIDSLRNLGLTILGTSRWFNAVIIESHDTILLDTLFRLPFISEFDYKSPRKKSAPGIVIPTHNDLPAMRQQDNKFEYGKSFPQISLLNGNGLHEMGYRGNNFQIAVIDGGFYKADIYPAFDSLWKEDRLKGYRDFTRSQTDFFNTASHGMSVLSTMAANIPGEIIGTAPKASYWLLKSEIVESETPLEEALWTIAAEFADSVGADIITSSLGYSEFDDSLLNYSYSDMDGKTTLVTRAAEKAFSKGMVVVISAGNQGNKPWKYLTAPSDGTNILCIGATDTSGIIAAYSSRGPSYDLRIKPDVMAVGYQAIVINSSGLLSQGFGTSYSSPQIAGMVACLWEAAPEKTNQEIIQSIRRSASNYISPDDSSGYGIPDFLKALFILKSDIPNFPAHQLSVVPNPNQGIFEIRSDIFSLTDFQISIFDAKGTKIFSGLKTFSAGFIRINELAGQSSGIYYILAESQGIKYFTNVLILKP